MGGFRGFLLFLYGAYLTIVAIIGSLIGFAIASVCIAVGVYWLRGGLPGTLGVVAGGAIILFGVSCFFQVLAGIMPRSRTDVYGDARTARLRDVRRSRIYRRKR